MRSPDLPSLRSYIRMLLAYPRCGLAPPKGWQFAALGDIAEAVRDMLHRHEKDPLARVEVPIQEMSYWLNEAVEHVLRTKHSAFTEMEQRHIREHLQNRHWLVESDRICGARLVALAKRMRPPLTDLHRRAIEHEKRDLDLRSLRGRLDEALRGLSAETPILVPDVFDARLVQHGLAETLVATPGRYRRRGR